MNGKPKQPKFVAARSRKILGENIQRRMSQQYADETDRFTALAEESGVRRSTIQRVINGEVGATIDTITRLAHALKCDVHELLKPSPKSGPHNNGASRAARSDG